jgi:hypothetical protein
MDKAIPAGRDCICEAGRGYVGQNQSDERVISRRRENAWPRRPRGLRDGSRNRKVPNDMAAGLNMERQNLDSLPE